MSFSMADSVLSIEKALLKPSDRSAGILAKGPPSPGGDPINRLDVGFSSLGGVPELMLGREPFGESIEALKVASSNPRGHPMERLDESPPSLVREVKDAYDVRA